MIELYFTRHGQTEWNVEGRIQGHLDSPLTELGVTQAVRLGESLSHVNFDVIYASPSARTIRTAELIRGNKDVAVNLDERLREIRMGSWEGMLMGEIEQAFPQEHHTYWHAPHLYRPVSDGETFFDVIQRTGQFVDELLSVNHDCRVLVVTHTVTLKVIMSRFEGRSLERLWDPPFIHPTSLSRVVVENGESRIEFYGDMSHVDKHPTTKRGCKS